jgi:ferredoxin-nitrite reductase
MTIFEKQFLQLVPSALHARFCSRKRDTQMPRQFFLGEAFKLEVWSLEKYLEEAEKLLGYKLLRVPKHGVMEYGSDGVAGNGDQRSTTPLLQNSIPHSHVGVFPRRQTGLNWIGVAVPVGNITPKQMLRLADLSDNYGSGEVRLTVWQNLVIPNQAVGRQVFQGISVEQLKRTLEKMLKGSCGIGKQENPSRNSLSATTSTCSRRFSAMMNDPCYLWTDDR